MFRIVKQLNFFNGGIKIDLYYLYSYLPFTDFKVQVSSKSWSASFNIKIGPQQAWKWHGPTSHQILCYANHAYHVLYRYTSMYEKLFVCIETILYTTIHVCTCKHVAYTYIHVVYTYLLCSTVRQFSQFVLVSNVRMWNVKKLH